MITRIALAAAATIFRGCAARPWMLCAVLSAGCASGRLDLEPNGAGWTRDEHHLVWREGDVEVVTTAFEDGNFPITGRVSNLGPTQVQVTFRRANDLVQSGVVVGERIGGQRDERTRTPIPDGAEFAIPGRVVGKEPSHVVFRVPRTSGLPVTAADRLRVGDQARVRIDIESQGHRSTCSFCFNIVYRSAASELHWYNWLALPLLPAYVVLRLFKAVD